MKLPTLIRKFKTYIVNTMLRANGASYSLTKQKRQPIVLCRHSFDIIATIANGLPTLGEICRRQMHVSFDGNDAAYDSSGSSKFEKSVKTFSNSTNGKLNPLLSLTAE